MGEAKKVATRIGLEATSIEIRRQEDIVPGLEFVKGKIDGIYLVSDGLIAANGPSIAKFSVNERIPMVAPVRHFVAAGALMSYGASFQDLFKRTADIVNKILRGTRPADIPVEQPTKFQLVINFKTAKALGLTIPPILLARADEVIE